MLQDNLIRVMVTGLLLAITTVTYSEELLPITDAPNPAPPVQTQTKPPNWQIIPEESSISFTAIQNNAPVIGQFDSFTGDIAFDPSRLESSHVKIIIDMNSVSTSYSQLADTLKAPEWFNVKIFPRAVFFSNKFTRIGKGIYHSVGMLSIRDRTMPVGLTFALDEFSKTKARLRGHITLRRTLFGIGKGDWAKTNAVKDDVQVNFKVIANKK